MDNHLLDTRGRPRVVITGMGMVSPLGNSVEESWGNLLSGVSGVGPITQFDASELNTRIAGEVKDFVARVRERSIGQEVMRSLTPGQQVVKIVHDELINTLGEPGRLNLGAQSPAVIMLVGLQGAGKTTMAGKLALHLRKQGRRPGLQRLRHSGSLEGALNQPRCGRP